MDAHLTQHKTHTLPLVFPLVIYNGDKTYPYSMDVFDLFSDTDRKIAKQTLLSPYSMLDLSTLDTRTIRDESWISIMLNALKYGPRRAQPHDIIALLEAPIAAVAAQNDIRYIETVFFYLCESKDSEFRQELLQEFHTKLQPILGERFMTSIADSFRQEGMHKGIQEGLQEGKHLAKLEVAQQMLLKGLDETVIADITQLSLSEIRKTAKKIKA